MTRHGCAARSRLATVALVIALVAGWLTFSGGTAWAVCLNECQSVPGHVSPQYFEPVQLGNWLHVWRAIPPARARGSEYAVEQYCYWRALPGCTAVGANRCPYHLTLQAVYQRPLGSPTTTDYTRPQMACILPAGPPPVTPADVRRVLRQRLGALRIAVRGDPLTMQPPHHRALALKPVIFYLRAPARLAPFVVLINQQRVTIAPYPGSYTWHFEPTAQTATTTDIGRPYPDQDPALAHLYGHLGTVRPYVTVNWRATFTIGAGLPQQAYPPGTFLPVDGPSQPMVLLNQRSVLVAPGG